MSDHTIQPPPPGRQRQGRSVLLEAALVTVAGVALAFAANWLSPRGLALSRNYFPASTNSPITAPSATNLGPVATALTTNRPSARELLAARAKAEGLRLIDRQQAEQFYHDPRRTQELVVFVDARAGEDADKHYQEGHIPGAYEYNRLHPENYLAAVLPACYAAQQVVVYCNGGDCDDSLFAAKDLMDGHVPNEKLYLYAGGMSEWATNGLPIEVGARLSGKLRESKK